MPVKCKCGIRCVFGLPGESAQWCKTCKPPEAIDVKSKKCPCGKQPNFNLPGEKSGKWCAYCPTKPTEAINIFPSKRCECGNTQTPLFNLPEEKSGKWCLNCPSKPIEAIDVKHKLCKCGVRPSYNLPGETVGIWCVSCKPEEAVNVISPRCKCGTIPTFNLPGETTGIWCIKCKSEEAVDVKHNFCKCGIRPTFNLPGETVGIWCIKCKSEEAIDVLNNRCSCGIQPRFNLPGEKGGKWCINCEDIPAEAIDVTARPCICGEAIHPHFNLPGEKRGKWCSKCKSTEAVDVIHKLCIECNTIRTKNPQYKDHCLRCFIYKFPDNKITSNYKIKEKHVFDAVLKLLPEDLIFMRDKIITGGCSRRRPDLMIDCGSHWICGENDEDSHKDYDNSCENKRMMELYQDMGNRPMILIRFNCDKTLTLNGLFKIHKTLGVLIIRDQKEFDRRIGVLANCIKKYLTVQPEKAVTIEYLFYDN